MSFKILKNNCCGLDVHKTWIYACIGITDSNGRTEYKQARFSSFTKGLQELCDWLVKYNCNDVCMESEYSCAVTPQVRQTGNRLSGLAGTAYASLLT